MNTSDSFDDTGAPPAGRNSGAGAEPFQDIDDFLATGGEERVMKDAAILFALLGGKLSFVEMQRVVRYARQILASGSFDISERRMISSIIGRAEGKLNEAEARLIYQTLTGVVGPLYGGGDGSSREEAVVVHATSGAVGIRAEYEWIASRLGPPGAAWEMVMQGLVKDGDRRFDVISIRLSDGTSRDFYFDVTAFFGDP